ncbi:MAG: 5-formyltetrahydrofolate cyclo-ligase [Candidatus Melainabacteria bacterium GWF2_37_15]|nr:MAG: 5-formyltetrahydrofolate cyclo-ligase [Candidatus Melainabacteria bacterium GWF2_37_15]
MSKTKQEYRIWAKATRKQFNIEYISNIICRKIQDLEEYHKAKNIAGFYPYDNEIDIKPLFQDLSKNWFLPVVIDKENMIFCPYETCSELILNKFGIYEPCKGKEVNINELDMIVIPALSVDENGNRLGYGKGYYDRFLAKLPQQCIKIVPILDELIVKNLPHNQYDIPVDLIVTQSGVYNF